MNCRFSIISIIMLLNISKTRAEKSSAYMICMDDFCLTKKKEALKIKTSSLAQKERPESYALAAVQFIYPCSSASQPSQMD